MAGLNTQQVLDNLDALENKNVRIRDVYADLEIFDWWHDYLSPTNQKYMRSFLKLAIELGYTGYACFKVGASGCANGMWAYKAESEDGYSPKGECIYRSFTPDYVHYDFCGEDGEWYLHYRDEDEIKTPAQLRACLKAARGKED